DAWNRLIQVNRAAQEPVSPPVLASDGQTYVDYVWTPGVFLKHYTYDGLGRLVRTLSPFPDPDSTSGVNRSERFYYDGIRRIQEVVADPILAIDDQLVQSDPGLQAAAAAAQSASPDPLDPNGTPMLLESEQDDTPGLQISTYLDREYVWGPGDSGVDELLVQYDRFRQAGYAVTDEGGAIVALCGLGGPGGPPRVVAQYTYDAYGQPVTATHFYAHGSLRCGHKG